MGRATDGTRIIVHGQSHKAASALQTPDELSTGLLSVMLSEVRFEGRCERAVIPALYQKVGPPASLTQEGAIPVTLRELSRN